MFIKVIYKNNNPGWTPVCQQERIATYSNIDFEHWNNFSQTNKSLVSMLSKAKIRTVETCYTCSKSHPSYINIYMDDGLWFGQLTEFMRSYISIFDYNYL